MKETITAALEKMEEKGTEIKTYGLGRLDSV